MKKVAVKLSFLFMGLALMSSSCGDDGAVDDPDQETTVVEVSGEISSSTTWSSDNIYKMTGKVWVTNGATLTIDAGTIIKADEASDPKDAVALIVTPGSMIDAEGTAASPIIFTTSDDDIDYETSSSLTSDFAGKWGGIVLMGQATSDHGEESASGVSLIEGVESTETRGQYGNMTLDGDNSGTLKYVSIRHGGASVTSDSELNGLSLYSVGSGTTLDYIEVFANDDDGIEFFGGTVTIEHALVVHCSDDSFDWDQGFSGSGQWLCSIHGTGAKDKGFECDGGEGDLSPNSIPVIGNFTSIGEGTETAIHLKKVTGGKFYNGIIHNFNNGVLIDGIDSANVVVEGITFSNDGTDPVIFDTDAADASDAPSSVNVLESDLSSISWTAGTADVIPSSADVGTVVTTPSSLETTTYRGAFDPTLTTTWAAGWTRANELGLID